MMRSLSSQEHDVALARGLNVLVFRMAESTACQQFQPELDEFVRLHPECAVWTVEALEQRDLSDRHGLRALPSIVIYRDGLPARRFAGGMTADDLGREVDEVATADMDEELNDWMLWMVETGEAGSPFIGEPPGQSGRHDLSEPVRQAQHPGQELHPGHSAQISPSQQFRAMTPGSSLTEALQPVMGSPLQKAVPAVHTVPADHADQAGMSADTAEHLGAGVDAWYGGDDQGAIRHFTAVLAQDPASFDALSGRGQVLADREDGAAALVDLDSLLGICPDPFVTAYARSARAFALAQVGRSEEADQEMAAALNATPDNAWAHLRSARIQILRGNRPAAEAPLRKALEAQGPPLTTSQRSLAEKLLRTN